MCVCLQRGLKCARVSVHVFLKLFCIYLAAQVSGCVGTVTLCSQL